jgi:hypothetical protein
MKIGRPGTGRGDKWTPADHDDHLVAYIGLTEMPGQKTSFGEADAVHCDYVVCIDDNFVGTDVLVFGVAVVPALIEGMAEGDNEAIVARLGKGNAKPGQNAPWLLYDTTDEDRERAAKWLDAYAVGPSKSGRYLIEPPAPAGADESF